MVHITMQLLQHTATHDPVGSMWMRIRYPEAYYIVDTATYCNTRPRQWNSPQQTATRDPVEYMT